MKNGVFLDVTPCGSCKNSIRIRIQFHNASILATKTRYMGLIVREATEIELHPYNINREGSFCLSKSWKPLISSLTFSGHDPRTLGDAVSHS
jgi:hypothetical protein